MENNNDFITDDGHCISLGDTYYKMENRKLNQGKLEQRIYHK